MKCLLNKKKKNEKKLLKISKNQNINNLLKQQKQIWEKLINKMEVRVNEQGKLLVVIDTFKGLLKEILSTFIIHLRSEDNVQIQVSIEKQPQKTKSKMLLYLHSPTFEESYAKNESKKRKKLSFSKYHSKLQAKHSHQKYSSKKSQSYNSDSNSDDSNYNSQNEIIESSENSSSSSPSQSSNSSSSSSSSSSYDGTPKVNNKDDDTDRFNMNINQDKVDEESEDYFKQMKRKYEIEFLEKEMLGNSITLYLEEAIKWDVFIRINFFEKLQTENEKLSMNLLLQQYFNENKFHLSQFTERFRSSNKQSAPRRVIQKQTTIEKKQADSKLKTPFGGQLSGQSPHRTSIFDKLKSKASSLKKGGENKATMMLQKAAKSVMINSPQIKSQNKGESDNEYAELDEDDDKSEDVKNHVFPENYCFVISDFVAMASMIKNKVRENYLPSALYEDEEYYLQQQQKQGKAFQHFENVISQNRVRRNTIAVVLGDKSPKNQTKISKRSFLAPNTFQSDQLNQEIKKPPKINKSIYSPLQREDDDKQTPQSAPSNSNSLVSRMKKIISSNLPKKPAIISTQDEKKKNLNNISFTSSESSNSIQRQFSGSPSMGRLSGFNNRLKSILLAQPSYFSNIEEAVKFEPKVRINCEISIQRLIDPEQKHFIVMYRGVFTKKPLQMIAIYYKTSKRKFYAEIWNIKTQKKVKQKIKFKQICYQIPYVKQLLQLKQYSEIGRRIFLTFKNALMIATYYLVNS